MKMCMKIIKILVISYTKKSLLSKVNGQHLTIILLDIITTKFAKESCRTTH